ncbi:hypothetical protein [Flammeovirga sp. SJP92]|uniref:hypothetical protein n=1 Tax=Flammeovirga sp. SJP92 TaxID=1775430 RepID=UPI000786C44D|nr:hypothetical protein [Flammeovirga sp. SJP92]
MTVKNKIPSGKEKKQINFKVDGDFLTILDRKAKSQKMNRTDYFKMLVYNDERKSVDKRQEQLLNELE